MQRYRRKTVQMSLNKTTSSSSSKQHHIANTQYNLEHFYLSKTQIYGKNNSKTLPSQQEQSRQSLSNVINKLQQAKTAADWFRETKVLKKRQNVSGAIDVKKSTGNQPIPNQTQLVARLSQLKCDMDQSFPQLFTKKFIIKSSKNYKSKEHHQFTQKVRSNP